jgi:hypothetical protein
MNYLLRLYFWLHVLVTWVVLRLRIIVGTLVTKFKP